jgi:hypothetical protein
MAFWDNLYWAPDRCVCAANYYDDDDIEDQILCANCQTQKAKAERQAVERAAEEARIQASPWRDEIRAIRLALHSATYAIKPNDRFRFFGQLLSTLAGYKDFLVANPAFRLQVAKKVAECRTNPAAVQTLGPLLDQTDALLNTLPYGWAKERLAPIKEELMAAAWAPARVERWVAAGLNPEVM